MSRFVVSPTLDPVRPPTRARVRIAALVLAGLLAQVVLVAPAGASEGGPSSGFHPLPGWIVSTPEDLETVSLEPESEAGVAVGEPIEMSLGHCGLLSPVDLDGSLWLPVAAIDASGGPLDTDDAAVELVNATAGTFTLRDEVTGAFETDSGTSILFVRAAASLDYPLCM